jgi:dGTPase
MAYETLSPELAEQILADRRSRVLSAAAFRDGGAVRRLPRPGRDSWISPFAEDIDSILGCPYYNRYADKTQVFSLFRNDDITRRGLHVQLMSRIARTLGSALGLNTELIEAISLGSELGHTPFARAGERYLDEIFFEHTGRHFRHYIQSVRVLDSIFPYGLTLQTLNGISAHCDGFGTGRFEPRPVDGFDGLAEAMDRAELAGNGTDVIWPATLEACVVRVADILAYIGKDREDAVYAAVLDSGSFECRDLGRRNDEIVNSLIVNIIENSYGKPYLAMDGDHVKALDASRKENHRLIYEDSASRAHLDETVRPMMRELYGRLLSDLSRGDSSSPVFTHHVDYVRSLCPGSAYPDGDPDRTVTDYISCMTDDYFIDLHRHFFPDSPYRIEYIGYFDPRFDRRPADPQ